MTYGYSTPRDFFESVREAQRSLEAKARIIEGMERTEQSLPSGIVPQARRGEVKPNAITDLKLDKLAEWAADIDECAEIIASAYSVLYGKKGSGGLMALLGSQYAEVLDARYIQLKGWEDVAALVGYSKRRCYEIRNVAFDFLEYNGLEATAEGRIGENG